MNFPVGFDQALEQAISAGRRAALRKGGGLVAGGLFVGLGLGLAGQGPWALAFGGVTVVAGAALLLKSPTTALERLRGATPSVWAPSPSHGVVVVAGTRLLAADLSVELDRHADHRVSSVSYEEGRHALQVQSFRIVQTRDGEREVNEREFITLDRSVTPAQGYALAKELLALSLR